MPLFRYQAIDVRGAPASGEVDCASRTAALDLLQQRGLMPISLSEHDHAGRPMSFLRQLRALGVRSAGSLDAATLLTMTQSLAALLKAGLTIDRALTITTQLTKQPQARQALGGLGKAVRAGRSFAQALADSGIRLPPYYVGMVQAGEMGGSLAQTLERLGELLRKQYEVRERIRSALIYPALLAVVVLVTVVLLLTFVLPRFEALFAESEVPLPWATRAVLFIGNFVSAYWWLLGFAVGAVAIGAAAYLRTPAGRGRIDSWLLISPLTLGLPVTIDTARLLRTLGTLLANGVQIGSAMRIARATLANSRLRQALDDAARLIKAGESTSAALDAVGVFPAQAVQLARVGEETGRLEELLMEAAVILENESQTRLARLLTLLVPALTIGMGLLIAGLIGAVLIGLLSVNDLAF